MPDGMHEAVAIVRHVSEAAAPQDAGLGLEVRGILRWARRLPQILRKSVP